MYIILLGAPGAGKGTQAPALATRLEVPHIASGDIFRENLKQGTELGVLAKSYMEKGQLVPDDVTIAMVKDRLSRPDCARGAILDGFPRTTEQARALDQALAAQGRGVNKVILVDVAEDELIRRLSGRWTCRQCQAVYHEVSNPPKRQGQCDACGGELFQRPDDTVETARNRLAVYFRETAPLIAYYREKGVLAEVNGQQDIEGVQRDMFAALKEGK